MKVSTMQMIMERINDVNEVKNMLNIYSDISDEEVIKLLNSLKSLDSNYSVCVATNKDLYKFAGSIDNLIKIMKVCTNKYLYELATNKNLQDFTGNIDDLVKVIKICENPVLCYIATRPQTFEYAGNIENLIIILNESIDFSKGIIKFAKKNKGKEFYKINCREEILNYIEKFKYINIKKVEHEENISQIESLQEMKSYIEGLEKEYGKNKDIKLSDKVFSYIPNHRDKQN